MVDKKKICLVFNHFQFADGVCRSAIAIANLLVRNKNVEVDLIPLFKYEKEALSLLDDRVNVQPVFRTYFRGFAQIVTKLPLSWLYKFIIHKKYDIEIAFQFGPATKIMSASTNKKCKHLVWMHGYDNGLTYLDYYKRYDKLITVSKCNSERFMSESKNIVPVDYSYNPIDDIEVINKSKAPINMAFNDGLKLVAVGRLSPEKGYERLVKVVSRLLHEGNKFTLYIIGDGPARGAIENIIENNNVGDNVILLGSQSNPHKYTSKCDIMVCSSFSEGYSTVCAEAIMQGIPVISTSVSGAEEIIGDSGAGMVVGMDDNDLYIGLKTILSDSSLLTNWKIQVARNKYKFSQEYRSNKLFKILEI